MPLLQEIEAFALETDLGNRISLRYFLSLRPASMLITSSGCFVEFDIAERLDVHCITAQQAQLDAQPVHSLHLVVGAAKLAGLAQFAPSFRKVAQLLDEFG